MGSTSDNPEMERKKRRREEDDGSPENRATDVILTTKRGCCFWIPYFAPNRSSPTAGSSSGSWERIGTAGATSETKEGGGWWKKGWDVLRKVRQWSEVVAGPRWKTFIRRFNKRVRKPRKFQYDPLSYAMNFDDGHGQNGHSDMENGYSSFSVRYASLPSSAKTSMDLGRDGPDFAGMEGHSPADAVAASVRHG